MVLRAESGFDSGVPRYLVLALVMAGLLGCRTGRNYPDLTGPRYAGSASVAAPRSSGDTLRIASFNIEFARHVDSAIALLRSDSSLAAADVLLLQEMDAPGAQRIAEALGMSFVYYPAIYHKRAEHDFGNAVLSRWPIIGDAKLILPHPSRYAGTHRIATAATIRVGRDTVRVYSTHLGTPLDVRGSRRREQLRAIIADAAPFRRVVIGGDLNDHGAGRVAVEMGYAWPTESGPKTNRLGRWDHIFLKGLAPADSNASGTVLDAYHISDHRPVWAIAILR
jgi:endonuclease/exonuclease/phosphatase family metal-dependent hydrolase